MISSLLHFKRILLMRSSLLNQSRSSMLHSTSTTHMQPAVSSTNLALVLSCAPLLNYVFAFLIAALHIRPLSHANLAEPDWWHTHVSEEFLVWVIIPFNSIRSSNFCLQLAAPARSDATCPGAVSVTEALFRSSMGRVGLHSIFTCKCPLRERS